MNKIEENFLDIYNCIYEKAGIDLHQKYSDGEISLSRKKFAPLECYNIEEKYIKEFKNEYKSLSHVRINPATKGYLYTTSNRDKLVAIINTENKDGVIWIQALEIFGEFKRTGMGLGLLDIAIKDLNATHLSVNKKNKVAMKLYLQYGFKIYDKTDKMYFMSIDRYNESYLFSERSHGNLKYSFRMGINVDDGHIVKIVFDLKSEDVDLIGSHDDTHPVKEEDQEKIRKNIRKTGYTDFTSTGKILAIVDMDTGKRLQTVNATGVMSGLQSFASKSLKEREKLAKDESSALHGFKTFTVGQKEGEGKRRPWSYATYKSTRPAKKLDDLSKFQNDPIKYGRGYVKESLKFLYEDMDDHLINEMGNNPQEIYNWMGSNISYDESKNWVLKTPTETIESGNGNCHDQSLLTKIMLDHLGYRSGQLFFIEYKNGTNMGGKTHTLTWYNENNQYYWMETAWEDQRGVHGPYNSVNGIKKDIVNIYNENIDNKYDGLVFGSDSTYETGMNLYEYVESWDCQDEYEFKKSDAKLIEEAFNEIESIVNYQEVNDHEYDSIPQRVKNTEIYTTPDLLKSIKTPDELLNWMKCIDYGWIDKSGKINGTDDNDETSHLYDEYRLQSPNQTIKNKVGLCWDQVELERIWFDKHIKEYVHAVIYVEVQNGEDCPTHTFLIYKECGETEEVNWFESSWKNMASIKHYKNLDECVTDAVGKVIESFNTDGKRIIRLLNKPMKPNITCEDYYQIARSSPEVDMSDISYDEIFNESHVIMEDNEEDNEYFDILKSNVDKDFKSKGHKSLSDFTRKKITKELTKKYKNDGNLIRWMRDYNPKYNDICYIWIDDNDDYVGAVTYDSKFDKDHHKWISGIDVANKYKGYGLGLQLLDYAVKHGGIDALTVQYDNEIAIKMYKNYGFEISKESEEAMDKKKCVTYDMFLSKNLKESFNIITEADSQVEDETENDNDNMPNDIDDKDVEEEIPSIEDEEISHEEDDDSSDILSDEIEEEEQSEEEQPTVEPEENKEEQKPLSMPKQTDKAESDKNGVRRKKLYIAFIEWAKSYNDKNTFGSLFDKDIFHITYPFVPEEMRYFYRLANPILCVLAGDLTFFQVSELRKLNAKNSKLMELMIFAATPNDTRVFNAKDKKVYRGTDENGQIKLNECLGDTFDTYIQNMIKKGDILNGPIDDDKTNEEKDSNK